MPRRADTALNLNAIVAPRQGMEDADGPHQQSGDLDERNRCECAALTHAQRAWGGRRITGAGRSVSRRFAATLADDAQIGFETTGERYHRDASNRHGRLQKRLHHDGVVAHDQSRIQQYAEHGQ